MISNHSKQANDIRSKGGVWWSEITGEPQKQMNDTKNRLSRAALEAENQPVWSQNRCMFQIKRMCYFPQQSTSHLGCSISNHIIWSTFWSQAFYFLPAKVFLTESAGCTDCESLFQHAAAMEQLQGSTSHDSSVGSTEQCAMGYDHDREKKDSRLSISYSTENPQFH